MIQGHSIASYGAQIRGYTTPQFRANSIVISIRPITDIWLDDRPEHGELCTIVWQNGKRLIKFINRACPYHCKTSCLVEAAN